MLPQPLLSQTEEKLACFSSTVSRIDQMVLNQFIREGHFERHLNRMRRIYGRKHDIFLEKLKELSGVIKITGENAGVHLLAEFQNGMSEEEALQKARKERVRVYPLSEYRTESSGTGGAKGESRRPSGVRDAYGRRAFRGGCAAYKSLEAGRRVGSALTE